MFGLGIENKNDKGESEKKNNLPKNIRLRSILFINIRPSTGLQVSIYLLYNCNNFFFF